MHRVSVAAVFVLGSAGLLQAQVNSPPAYPAPIGDRPGDVARGMVTNVPDQAVRVANPIQGQLIAEPGPTPGANNNNNSNGTATKGGSPVPAPGSLVIHFNARVTVQWYQGWNSLMNQPAGSARTSNQISTWMRLYGGADGMAVNGLRYGGAWEARMNASGASNTPSIANPASQAGAFTNTQTLYMRRAFIYAGTDRLGILRLGTGDGLISLFDGGRTTLQGYSPTGNLNGSDLQDAIGGSSVIPWAFLSGSGDEYSTQKIVYLSPNFSGFDFGLQYSPSAANGQAFCSGLVTSACSNITTSTVVADGARYKDMVAAGIRYAGSVGPMRVHAYGVYSYAGHVNYGGSAGAARAAVGAPAGSAWNGQFDNLNFGSAGVALTYEGFTVGANFLGGAVNGRMAASPAGGAGTNAWLIGAEYKVAGLPLTVGGVFITIDSQGAVAMTGQSQRHEYGASFGGSYTLAPGMVLFADYLYQNRKQSGWNFASGTANPSGVGQNTNSTTQGQGFVFGTQMTW